MQEQLLNEARSEASANFALPRHGSEQGEMSNSPNWKQPDAQADSEVSGAGLRPKVNPSNEVTGVNRHTRNVEFYGSSSTVALLSHLQRSGEAISNLQGGDDDQTVLVTSLHNPVFSPSISGSAPVETDQNSQTHYYRQCRGFLHNFFNTMHFIHPLLDRSDFLNKCEDLWYGNAPSRPSSFTALYYSIMSLGALFAPREEDLIDGIDNLQWSRRFFEEARVRAAALGMVTNLEMVQCYVFLVR